MRTNVYLTIDTEHSMGGAWANPLLRPVSTERRIFCRIGGKDYGIGWLCEELERRGLRATFFAEMFGSLIFGKDDTRAWCQYLLARGQDVQLHTHLNFYYYAQQRSGAIPNRRTDDLVDVPSPVRGPLLDQACEIFSYATGYSPKCFRAGNWRADRLLVADVAKRGILLDSSFNPAARGRRSFAGEGLQANLLQRVDPVWELPLSVLHQSLPEPHLIGGLRPFDLVSMSSSEIRKALDTAHAASVSHVVTVLHSFSAIKPRDAQYRQMKPNRVVQNRVRFFLDYLASNPGRFRVSTCTELVSELANAREGSVGKIPDLGLVRPLVRNIVQAMNSLYWI